jgi:hypothetical protein
MRSVEPSRLIVGGDINPMGAMRSMVGPTFRTGEANMPIGSRTSPKPSGQESVSTHSKHRIEGELR